MYKFIVIVAALMLSAATVSTVDAAPAGKPFLRGVISPTDLANRIEQSLWENRQGTKIIDPELCMKNGSCATANDYLVMFQESDPGANLTKVAEIPGFLRTLKVVDGPPGEYWVACLKPAGKGTFTPVLHCLSRRFKPGEKAWIDPKTKKIVLASDCTNPVEKEVPPKVCVEVHFFTKPGDKPVRFALFGHEKIPIRDECISIKRAGESEFDSMHNWTDECERRGCDFSEVTKVLKKNVLLMGSYIPAHGEHVLRLPAYVAEKGSPYVVALCLERGDLGDPNEPPKEPIAPLRPVEGEDPAVYAEKFVSYMEYLRQYEEWSDEYNEWRGTYRIWRDTWIADHSDGIGVNWYDYRMTSSGTKVATVYYTKEEIPPGLPILYWPWNEYK